MDNLDNWGIDGLIKKGGVMILKGGEEMKVIRSGDKNFEEEKIEMFKHRTLSKEEQLRLVFSHLFASMITEYIMLVVDEPDKLIEKYTNIFMKEIKIRVKL